MQTKPVIVKLKSDIESKGEVDLAKRELSRLCMDALVEEVPAELAAGRNIQKSHAERFLRAHAPLSILDADLLDRLAYGDWYSVANGEPCVPQQAVLEKATSLAANGKQTAKTSRRNREYLGHGIHKYKAKFFPRFARSLINITCPHTTGVVLDPFCGSGTTALESGLMGLGGICNDIDPLSCLISRHKALFALLPYGALEAVGLALQSLKVLEKLDSGQFVLPFIYKEIDAPPYRIPDFLRQKIAPEIVAAVEAEATRMMYEFSGIDDVDARGIAELLLSHALSTKISLRWMGTGDNRFSVNIAKRSLVSLALSHLKRLQLNHPNSINFAVPEYARTALLNTRILNRSAEDLDIAPESVDAIVTSPPYLPATSGRETYLRSRAPAIVGLNLLSEESIRLLDSDRIIGSVLRQKDSRERSERLPKEITEFVEWARPQRARKAKADPTLEYFHDLYRVGLEMLRVLKPGGKAAIVVATAHTFYEASSREIVRVFPLSDVIKEFFTDPKYGIEFSSVESIELELPKQDYAARPAGKHSYSETALIFEK